MPPVTPRKLKSCLSSSSPSDCSSPTNSIKSTSSKATTATPPTPYSSGGSSCYSTPTPTRRHKKSVRFKAEEELAQVKQYIPAKPAPTPTTVAPKKKKEEVVDVKKGKKRKESSEDTYYDYHDSTVSKIIESGPAGLGITVDHTYGPPTKAPPQAPLPRPTKRERTKYSQSPPTKSVESPPPRPPPKSTDNKMTYSFDDSTSTSTYPDRSFGQAPPPPAHAQNSSFTEIASYPPVPQIMSTGYSFTEQTQPEQTWWAYQEPEQPPMVAAASRPLRRKRSFEARKTSDSRNPFQGPEIVDVDSMRSHRGSSKSSSSTSSKSSRLPTGSAYKEPKPESSSRTSSRRRREEEEWAEQYRLETLKKQARQKTRDREIKKHTRADPHGSFSRDAGAGYYNHKAAAYSFNANEGYDQYF